MPLHGRRRSVHHRQARSPPSRLRPHGPLASLPDVEHSNGPERTWRRRRAVRPRRLPQLSPLPGSMVLDECSRRARVATASWCPGHDGVPHADRSRARCAIRTKPDGCPAARCATGPWPA
jgi:hypothetical protein